MSGDELVSVVIPARNEAGFIDACLLSVREQDYSHLEIIVVDGASTDDTVDRVKRHVADDDRVVLVHNPRGITPVSMNVGLTACRSRWLVRIDAHATVGPGYVRRCVEHLRTGRWGGVGGRKDGVGRTTAGRAIAVAMAHPFGVGGSVYHHGTDSREVDHVPFGAYPVELARQLGGWDERLTANQDFEFDYRLGLAGHKILFDPRIMISWHCRQSVRDLYRQYHRYGRGKVVVARLHPASMRPRHLAPPALVAWAAAAAALATRRPGLAAAMVAPYVAGLVVASVHAAGALDSGADRARVPAAFAAMHIGWGTGFWAGLGNTALACFERPGAAVTVDQPGVGGPRLDTASTTRGG